MPMVAEMLARVSDKEPDRSMSPDEAVAHGAALYAGQLTAGAVSPAQSFDLVNVNSHSLGIVGIDQRENRERNVVLIPKNTPLPCRAVRSIRHGARQSTQRSRHRGGRRKPAGRALSSTVSS